MPARSYFSSFLIVSILAMLTACNSDKKAQQEMFDEVMSIHDEVMPKMGSLKSLAKQLNAKADSLALDSLTDNGTQIDEMKKLARDLKEANESMMEWMRQFEQVEEGTPHGEVIQYLSEQRKQIRKVRDDMLESEDSAKKYLAERF